MPQGLLQLPHVLRLQRQHRPAGVGLDLKSCQRERGEESGSDCEKLKPEKTPVIPLTETLSCRAPSQAHKYVVREHVFGLRPGFWHRLLKP